jgi:quercetin 2,3-dioxygenase
MLPVSLKNFKMIVQIPAQMYKSETRGLFKSEKHNCFATFNFGHCQDLSRKPFGSLQILNEIILAPQQSVARVIKEKTNVIILPLFGGIEYKDNLGNEEFLRVEQIQITGADDVMSFEISNPYENENVSYLQIDFQMDEQQFKNCFQQSEIDFNNRNKLIPLFEIEKTIGFIGVFDGRKEGFYSLKNPENGIFVFIINGAFEVENRLLEAKDGLSMKEINRIEWEALSENAILLVFEVSLKD